MVCSIMDIRKKAINSRVMIIAVILMLISGLIFYRCGIVERLAGILPGVLFIITGYLTKGGIGLADSIFITSIGIGLGITGCISVIMISLSLSGLFAIMYLVKNYRNGNCRKKTIPFIPFVFFGFVINEVIKYAS